MSRVESIRYCHYHSDILASFFESNISISVCCELWEFAGDDERYNEKFVHSFLPASFIK